ncbi:MAG: shikimate dehydrogenase [Candidatus Cyclobacteriaceae bacterium M2_1C_046]
MNLTEFKKSKHSSKPHFLLFGNPVYHSLSPLMHNTAARYYDLEAEYHAIELKQSELSSLAAHLNKESFRGANITIPYKQLLIDFMDRLDSTASDIGAVNTIVRENSSMVGYNTDSHGFSVPLQPYSKELEDNKAIIFGTGGATRAIIHALKGFNIREIILISRNPEQRKEFDSIDQVSLAGYENWMAYADDASLVVNATPLGMSPKSDKAPIRNDEGEALSDKICYDIVYNPVKTKFLALAEEAGARTIGGLEMLIHQGSKSFELWTGRPFPIEEVRNKLYEAIQ